VRGAGLDGAIIAFRVDDADEDGLCALIRTMAAPWCDGASCRMSFIVSREALAGRRGPGVVVAEIEGAPHDHIASMLASSPIMRRRMADGSATIRPLDNTVLAQLRAAISDGTFVGTLRAADPAAVRALFRAVN
jgi:hypothetical protein